MVNAKPITCLSTCEHNDRVVDISLHYFGCLKVRDQEKYFALLPSMLQERIRKEEQRVTYLRAVYETRPTSYQGKLLKDFKINAYEWHRYHPRYEPSRGSPWPLKHGPEERLEEDLEASMIYFKDGRPYNIPGVAGAEDRFPHQKISVYDLLTESQDNPIMRPCPENMIRYFHLPANNMAWIEEIMARYYHEEKPELDDSVFDSRYQTRTRTQRLLRPEFWRGQSVGSEQNSEVHARYMRPLCEVINSNPTSMESSRNNLVLFMQYLHWETDRARTKCSDTMKDATQNPSSTLAEVVEQAAAQEQIDQPIRHSLYESFSPSRLENNVPLPRIMSPTRARRRKALAQLLLLAASLYETMNSHTDRKLILEYLHNDPPLHPRRTLDQSYYGALKSTHARDRDQVVYRYTTPTPHVCQRHPGSPPCPDCMADIQKIPKVIMVDQLWMWILDERTIVTSFPQRWGRLKHDSSAVHKSLRERLRNLREGEIGSVFDLALIVVDECSRVLFDRSRIKNRPPNLADIFSDAIQGVTYKETAAFDQFLFYTRLASLHSIEELKDEIESSLLNINNEGDLLKEIKDILDELHILIQINSQQQKVAESFVRHIRHILTPHLHYPTDLKLESPIEATPFPSENAETREYLYSAKSTLIKADILLRGIQGRINELRTLEKAAKNTSASLRDLLSLKQQQASVIEAREAVNQGRLTLKQGQSILLFTVVTIVFLPLSFFGTLFGMNSAEFNGGTLTLRQQLIYMIPISIAFIVISLLFAFTHSSLLSSLFSLISAIVSYPYNISVTWFLTSMKLYASTRNLKTIATRLKRNERKITAKMEYEAFRARTARNLTERMDFWSTGREEDNGGEIRQRQAMAGGDGEELREIGSGDLGRRSIWTIGGRNGNVESSFGSQRNLVHHGAS